MQSMGMNIILGQNSWQWL